MVLRNSGFEFGRFRAKFRVQGLGFREIQKPKLCPEATLWKQPMFRQWLGWLRSSEEGLGRLRV